MPSPAAPSPAAPASAASPAAAATNTAGPRVARSYELVVGLEVHVQLATATKLFTAAPNGAANPGAAPNSLVDPVVLGLPGVLPVMNRAAVESSIKVGLALGCAIARRTKWDRKSYYYPDLPKNYQVSQYDEPLCGAGTFELEEEDGTGGTTVVPIRVRRAHLEEDAGKLLHEAPGGFRIDHSIVDLNRAGTPLLEIVTEPDFRTPRQVSLFAQEVQRLVRFLGVSEGQMQLGHMRFEPNINLRITDADGVVHKTAITEVKNLNSFSVLERATAYEAQRQLHAWESTGSLGTKSTYGWDEARGQTYWQRDKEEAGDYRYFPDPDLVPVEVDDAWLADLRSQVGELPRARRRRYATALGLPPKDAALLAADRATGDFFEQILAAGADAKRAAGLMETLREIANDRELAKGRAASAGDGDGDGDAAEVDGDDPGTPASSAATSAAAIPAATGPAAVGVSPARLAEIAALVAAGKLAGNKETARAVIAALADRDRPAEQAAADLGLIQSTDTAVIDALVDALVAENPKSLQDYVGGKQVARGALIGMLMKRGKGLNAKLVGERLDARVKR